MSVFLHFHTVVRLEQFRRLSPQLGGISFVLIFENLACFLDLQILVLLGQFCIYFSNLGGISLGFFFFFNMAGFLDLQTVFFCWNNFGIISLQLGGNSLE